MGALDLSPQALYGAELKLLDSSFAPPKLKGDLTDALLLDEAQLNHAVLRFREPVHQLEKHGGAVDFSGCRGFGLGRRMAGLSPAARPMVGNDARGNSMQPGGERRTSPFEALDTGKCFPEDVGGQILGEVAVVQAPGYIGVHAREVALVQIGKSRGVALRGLDFPFVVKLPRSFSVKDIRRAGPKVTAPADYFTGILTLWRLPPFGALTCSPEPPCFTQ